jgi:hypothetical protein
LSFVAIGIGLFVAAGAFFIYQSLRSLPQNKIPTITLNNPTPTPQEAVLLSIDSPADESVQSSRNLTISGKTDPQATLILNTDSDDQVVTPTSTGNFSLTTIIDTGVNIIHLTAVTPDGQENKKTFTVSSTTEDF